MKITELIDKLTTLLEKHGDIEVYHDLDVDSDLVPVEAVEFCDMRLARHLGAPEDDVLVLT